MSFNLGSLGSLFIDLAVGTGKFEQDLGRAARLLEKRADEIEKSAARMSKKVAGYIGTAVAGGGITLLIKGAMDDAARLDDLSQRVAVSVERLSTLRYAGNQNGVQVEQLAGAIDKLNKSAVESLKVGSEQGKVFKSLGIDVTDANGRIKPSTELLEDLADAAARFNDSGAKTAAITELIGKGNADMIPFLNKGAAGIRGLEEEARRMNQQISSETAQAASEFNNNLSAMKGAANGLFRKIGEDLAPELAKATRLIKDPEFQKSVGNIVNDLAKMTSGLIKAAPELFRIFAAFRGGLAGFALGTPFGPVGQFIGTFVGASLGMSAPEIGGALMRTAPTVWNGIDTRPESLAAARASNPITGLSDGFRGRAWDAGGGEWSRALERGAAGLKGGAGLDYRPPAAGGGGGGSGKPGSGVPEIDWLAAADLDRRLREMEELDNRARSIAQSMQTPYERWQERIAGANELATSLNDLGDPLLSAQDYTRELIAANEEYWDSLERVGDQGEDTFNRLSVFADQAARNMQSSLADFFFDPFEDGLSGMARGFADTMRRMAAEMAASEVFRWAAGLGSSSNPILSAIGNFAAGQFGAAFGGSSSGGGYTGLNYDIDPSTITFGGGRANGGDIQPNRWYTIGENGPEKFYSGVAGTVVPFAKPTGGGTTVQVINNTGETARTERATGPNGEELIRVIVGEVDKRIAQGGSTSRAIASSFGLQRKSA